MKEGQRGILACSAEIGTCVFRPLRGAEVRMVDATLSFQKNLIIWARLVSCLYQQKSESRLTMVNRCCVGGCNSGYKSDTNDQKRHYFAVPKDNAKKILWEVLYSVYDRINLRLHASKFQVHCEEAKNCTM